ncbi:suppressor of RPS4-RLD 1-like [Branchiostoma floridae]|uniref:Suppressor of RPS4-RLD 1-like n=1 Tax=Branchiostoma floridae TaxID=7739 RepID=A0A9J7LDP9_BRAFL|nr:suppressor of RPS4-RLD 1-like [Branchiostoma floridae]
MADLVLPDVLVSSQRHYIQGRYNDAIKLLSQVLKDKGRSLEPREIAAVHCNLASCYLKLGLLRKVVSSCDSAIKADAASLQAYLYKGKALHRLKKPDQARQVWESALGRYGDFQVLSEILGCIQCLEEDKSGPTPSQQTKVNGDHADYGRSTTPPNLQQGTADRGDSEKTTEGTAEGQGNDKTAGGTAESQDSNKTTVGTAESQDSTKAAVGTAEGQDSTKTTGGFLDPRSPEFKVGRGFLLVNEGNYEEAIKLFNTILQLHPMTYKAYVGRGTAYAMTRQLLKAEADFTQALTLEPKETEIWKRRGQVRAALGQEGQAIEDLNRAQSICKVVDVDIQKEVGLIYQAKGDNVSALMHFKRADKVLLVKQKQGELDKSQAKTLWNAMGLCQNSLGYCMDAVVTYQRALNLDPDFRESIVNMAQAYKDYGNFEKADELFARALRLDPRCVTTLNLHGLCLYGAGEIRCSYETHCKLLEVAPHNEDCLYMHGISAQALGLFRKAVESFTHLNGMNPAHWAFYTRELCLFQHHHLDMPLKDYNADIELHECFKEAWTKRLDPTHLTFDYCKQADFSPDIADVDQDAMLSTAARDIAKVAFPLGDRLQYDTPGFLVNKKQHRWFGLAMVDMAQTVQRVWRVMRKQDTSGSIMVTGRASSGCRTSHVFGWRDLFDIAVKWRQASEPNDPVWWVDLLNQETFTEGFGSQTPMILGQCHVVRYYPYWKKAFPLMKDLMKDQCNPSPAQLEQINEAQTPHDLYAIRSHDFYVATPCHSQAAPGRIMEGTRLTIQKKTRYGYTCSIRTPGTPARWKQFDQEMAHAWERLCEEAVRPQPDTRTMYELSATLAYYWYNFMPLSRGSAACGLLSLHALLLAMDLQIEQPIPAGLQVDWEAIFLPTPRDFIGMLDEWVGSSLQHLESSPLRSLPNVSETFPTLRSILEILNHEKSL